MAGCFDFPGGATATLVEWRSAGPPRFLRDFMMNIFARERNPEGAGERSLLIGS
ncbi:hypothetical protein RESH_02310 [Rhodopirellula europaea SH398]|uniref:Uncharacterized protein n=1 Tax=Rhodopirellula europaea SH398 TaxID=1263868 RepID=M5S694_9BACT|nr:hypothetical protein RESH_02310 [Rhodopirellula europaea SH398]